MQINNKTHTHKSCLINYFICMCALSILCYYFYGLRALIVIAVAVSTSLICDIVCLKLRHIKFQKSDLSTVVYAVMLAMLMPASIPYKIVILSCIFMIVVMKHALGGEKTAIFHPVAVTFVITALCFQNEMFSYPRPVALGSIDLSENISQPLYHSLWYTLKTIAKANTEQSSLKLGSFLGAMGTTHTIVILICALCLLIRRNVSIMAFVSSLSVILADAFFFPPAIRESKSLSVLYTLCCDSLLFVLIFIASDYYYCPKKRSGRLIYGIILGLLTILYRRYADVECAVLFALICLTPFTDLFDRTVTGVQKGLTFISKKILIFIIFISKKLWSIIKKYCLLLIAKIKKSRNKSEENSTENKSKNIAENKTSDLDNNENTTNSI